MRYRARDFRTTPQFDIEWVQYQGTTREYSYDFRDWLITRGATQKSLQAVSIVPDGIMRLHEETSANGLWTAKVEALQTGLGAITLKIEVNETIVDEFAVLGFHIHDVTTLVDINANLR